MRVPCYVPSSLRQPPASLTPRQRCRRLPCALPPFPAICWPRATFPQACASLPPLWPHASAAVDCPVLCRPSMQNAGPVLRPLKRPPTLKSEPPQQRSRSIGLYCKLDHQPSMLAKCSSTQFSCLTSHPGSAADQPPRAFTWFDACIMSKQPGSTSQSL